MIEHPFFNSHRVYKFVDEYVKCQNATKAAIDAGYSPRSAGETGARLAADPRVKALIEAGLREAAELAKITVSDVLKMWMEIAGADPSKIVKVRRLNCRHCWGKGHEYQWTQWEYNEACSSAMANEEIPPRCDGGLDFRFNADPNPECPRCEGEGKPNVYFADTSLLTGPERRLIAGVKQTKDGLEIKMRDQDGAVANLAKYLGMLVEKRELSGKDGTPLIPPAAELPADPQQLAVLYGSIMKLTGG